MVRFYASLIKRFAPPTIPGTAQQKVLAQLATVRRMTRYDGFFVSILILNFIATCCTAAFASWLTPAPQAIILTLLFLLLLAIERPLRPLLGRILLAGLIASICELFTDASGEQIARSLHYPTGTLLLWASPLYMPFSWLVVLTPLIYAAWRLGALVGQRATIVICGLCGAIEIPIFEEIAYHAGWWHYTSVHLMLGHTPAYVLLFEGLVIAGLPLIFDRIERRSWPQTMLIGLVLGCWMACAALIAWVLLGLW